LRDGTENRIIDPDPDELRLVQSLRFLSRKPGDKRGWCAFCVSSALVRPDFDVSMAHLVVRDLGWKRIDEGRKGIEWTGPWPFLSWGRIDGKIAFGVAQTKQARSSRRGMVSLVEESEEQGIGNQHKKDKHDVSVEGGSDEATEGESTEVDPKLYEVAQKAREEGNEAFRQQEYEVSIFHYERALEHLLHPSIVSTKQAHEIYVLVRSNMAAAYLKLEEYQKAREQCNFALATDAGCAKALFRRAEAWRAESQFSNAIEDLEKALRLQPNNMSIKVALDECEEELDLSGYSAHPSSIEDGKEEEKPLDERTEAFVRKVVNETKQNFQKDQHVVAGLILEHEVGLAKELKWGRITIGPDAFATSENLESMTSFVRSKQATSSAHAACMVVQKSDIQYPLVWWSGPWPWMDDLECDGVFVELETRDKRRRTWFLRLDTVRHVLEEPTALDARCRLADSSFFP